MKLTVKNSHETEALAKVIGTVAQAGDIIILSGDLGAGKTTMTKGIALGLGIDKMIKSPTYTIIREYQGGRLPLYHMDVYRVEGQTEDLGLEEYFEGEGLSVVEWGQLLGEDGPEQYLAVDLEKNPAAEEERMISLDGIGAAGSALLERIEEQWKENGK
ncbi:tRNA (adenosine(37)-N6)-threonylcarbamoyltransferase complex ATPase subunit type 1 TsaE [Enterococcus sp. BWM-S5]|uniref:tRNA threonylcarbamoyladenosine biosynthesis protein TsaE n=1 Tax=Enterococcus larvae TaxID=2794352 RepID=A0ABS4CMG0_9ENTE|nr:tRNA (adenosine(37)-N6)-threonylcarbamoyltransferase complex ATPase subunit type 1 TsaE [Enterococcus larvae]MBP1046959.1 tRNA (adenosine(37)-N6)-threonylcarbamoyltransferase complex ATPase subunit type 1 TsaE [Enterococcus larvae]